MPVFVNRGDSAKKDVDPKSNKPFRHVNPGCKGYTKHPESDRSGPVRNTQALRDQTVRCPLPGDWDVWEREQALAAKKKVERDAKKSQGGSKKKAGAGKTDAGKAASQPAAPTGGQGAKLAERAKAARQRAKPNSRAKTPAAA